MLQIQTLVLTPIQQNTRVVYQTDGSSALIIDPAGDADEILGFLSKHNLTVTQIWLTHSHLDHCGGVADIKAAFPAATLSAHPDEKLFRERVASIAASYGMPTGSMKNCPEPDIEIRGGETLQFEGYSFSSLFTSGHSPGHIAFYQQEMGILFGGDALFAGSIGRTDLPAGNHEQLLASIKEKIFTLPDDTQVLSGHGPNTTVGREKASNPFFR